MPMQSHDRHPFRPTAIDLRAVGPFDDCTIELGDGTGGLVLLEGPNGSGKTTIVEAIALLVGSMGDLPGSVGYRDRSNHWGWVSSGADPHPYAAQPDWRPMGFSPLMPPEGAWAGRFLPGGQIALRYESTSSVGGNSCSVQADGRIQGNAVQALSDLVRCAADDSPPATVEWAAFAFRGHARTPLLKSDGPSNKKVPSLRGALSFGAADVFSSSLGQFLVNADYEATLAARRAAAPGHSSDEALSLLRQRPADIVAFEKALSVLLERRVTVVFPDRGNLFAPDIQVDDQRIPLNLLGEGLRHTFAWVSDLLTRLLSTPWQDRSRSATEQPFLLLLDEIDESLHPKMQARLYPTLRGLFPNAHIIATTHSPFAVASIAEGFVVRLSPDASTRRLSGTFAAQPLRRGASLEEILAEVFDVTSTYLEPDTRRWLDEHQRLVDALRVGVLSTAERAALSDVRARLLALGPDIQTLVHIRESPVRGQIAAA